MKRIAVATALTLGIALCASAQNYPAPGSRDRAQESPNYQNSRDRTYNGTYADTIPAGTQIRVRTNEIIDARDRSDGRIYTGTVVDNVTNPNGAVVIPRGAAAELIVNNLNNNELAVDLESITVNGRRYMVSAENYERARNGGLGKNKRTGEFVGGGALLGTVIGAIAGGGKGAAIGALAGGGAGAGAQVLTRGKTVHIPAESVLTFRLQDPFQVGANSRDNGYDRDGHHYRGDYYGRQPENRQPPPQQ